MVVFVPCFAMQFFVSFRVLQPSHYFQIPGRVAQSATCLAADTCLTADPGVASLIHFRGDIS